ncbi:MAG: hypothetical protein AAF632_29535 [Bacteroidota bacterium]
MSRYLLAVAIIFGAKKYGWIPIVRTAGLVVFLAIVVTNTIELYKAFVSYLKVKKWRVTKGRSRYLVVSYTLAVVLYLVALTDYHQKLVLIFTAVFLGILFLFDRTKALL